MAALVPIYCLITAITVVFAVIHTKLLFAFYAAACALLAVAAGDEFRGLIGGGDIMRKLARAILGVVILVIALWMGQRCAIDLYYRNVNGTLWAALGVIIGFFANDGRIALPRSRR